jgi:hypothetical protein
MAVRDVATDGFKAATGPAEAGHYQRFWNRLYSEVERILAATIRVKPDTINV